MTAPDQFDPQLLDRYLAGTASDTDVRAVVEWMARDPRNRALIDGLSQPSSPALPLSTDDSWRVVAERLRTTSRAAVPVVSLQRHRPRTGASTPAQFGSSTLLKIAAALVLCTGSVFAWRAARAPELHEVVAGLGKSTTLTLDDGSRVTLAPGSRLTWTGRFGASTREISLTGEGYFDVVHDASRPFRVRAQAGVAEDIGTRFVVRAWSSSAPLDVAVEEGAVALSDSSEAARLTATTLRVGDRGRLDRNGTVAVTHDAELLLAWTRGELVFADTPLADALLDISRWYNADVQASPALVARQLNARFLSQPLPDLLNALALALDARVVQDGSRVTLVPNTP